MNQQEMDELKKAIYGDKPVTTTNSRGIVESTPTPCAHDWGNIHDDHNGVYRCKKCGKYSA